MPNAHSEIVNQVQVTTEPRDQLLVASPSEDCASSGEPRDQRLGKISAQYPKAALRKRGRGARHVNPFAFRRGFDSVVPPSRNGFTFGCAPECTIRLPMGRGKCRFAIRYVLESGSPMVTAHMPTKVGDKCLENAQSLLLMPNTIIQYTVRLRFSMDSHCVQSHKLNYLRYSVRFGVEDARYLPTSISQPVVVGDYQKNGNSWGEWLWGYSPGGTHQNGQ